MSSRILAGSHLPEPKTSLKCFLAALVSGKYLKSLEKKNHFARSLGALYRRDLVLSYNSVAVAIASVAGRLHFRPQPVLRGDQEPPPHSHCYRCVRAHSSRIIRCGYVGLTLCGAGPLYSLDSTRGDGINRSLSRSLRHRLIQTHLRDG